MPMGMPRSSDELATLLWDAEYRPTTIAPDVHGQRRERQRGKCIRIASIAPDDATILLHHANSGRMEFSERTNLVNYDCGLSVVAAILPPPLCALIFPIPAEENYAARSMVASIRSRTSVP